MQLEERFLGQVLGFSDVPYHAQAQRIDASFVKGIELGKRVMITGLGARERVGFGTDGRRRGRRGRILHRRLGRPRGLRGSSFRWLYGIPGLRHSFPWGIKLKT